jgi:hypothetical protein
MRILLLLACLAPAVALAHRPTFGSDFSSRETAYVVDDPDISIALYQPVTCERPEVWLTFEGVAGYELFVQAGVPEEIDRLADYRPSLAVLAPGLPPPPAGLPFEVPAGLGAKVLAARATSERFFEPFTSTASRVWVEETLTLPADGRGFLVAFDPAGRTGKLWVAVGTIEDFSGVEVSQFLAWTEQVNAFHETGRFEEPAEVEERWCRPEQSRGCASAGAPGFGLLLAATALRRRRT